MPLTTLGLPLGYGLPGITPQEEIMATGALQPTLHTLGDTKSIVLNKLCVYECHTHERQHGSC